MFDIQPAIATVAPPTYPQGGHVPLSTDLAGNTRVSVVAGGGGPVTIADGADVAEGSTTDVAVTTDANGTLSAKLRGIIVILLRMFQLATPIRNQQVGIATDQIVDGGGNAVSVTGNRLDVNTPANASQNITQLAGNAIATNAGGSSAGTERVVQASAPVVNITQVTVPATVNGILLIGANANRIKVRITNTGTTPVYIYKDNTVTTLIGDLLAGIAGYPWMSRYNGTLYGIVGAGTQVVTVYEESSV
jgi:hypothetical protein